YGMNFFTNRLEDALNRGPTTRGFRQPLLISEFGPVGLRSGDRGIAYQRLWNIVRAHPNNVLGGCAYVWTTAGPEALDRNFGLTHNNGIPVDNALSALSAAFLKERAALDAAAGAATARP